MVISTGAWACLLLEHKQDARYYKSANKNKTKAKQIWPPWAAMSGTRRRYNYLGKKGSWEKRDTVNKKAHLEN